MRMWHLFVMVAIAGASLFLAGCECDPVSDGELCGTEHCGQTTLTDNCGEQRNVDCGDCQEGARCEDNQCLCDHIDRQQLCDDADINCGTDTITDPCGDDVDLFCGGCVPPDECVDNQCVCTGESQRQLCTEQGYDCGEATVEDGCGDVRTIDCGDCTGTADCIDNVCDCIGEDDSELCNDAGAECGEITATDRCGDSRTADCGDCTGVDQCVDGACECIGEDDDQLCADAGACGTVELTDQCGDERTVNCQDCPSGDATFGAVRDGATGALLADADINIYQWPPDGGEHYRWSWPAGYRANNPDISTTTSSSSNGDFNYEFASHEPVCIDDQIATLEQGQIYRIVVDHPDYDPGIFYRLHTGYDSDNCPDECPTGDDTRCQRYDFELFEQGSTYPRYPNLVVDQRDLYEHEFQCAILPDDADEDELVGLRVRLGAANVGPGPFHLEGIADDNEVVQYVENTDGSVDTYTVDSEFYDHDEHGHIHFMNWFRMSLVDPSDACADVDDRSDDCLTREGQKISYCLHDLEPFDGDVADEFGGTSSLFPDPPTCDTSEQGITQGWIDTYGLFLPGQVIIIGEPSEATSLDEQWIEGEVDPEQVLQEVERDGNVARITIDVPDGDDICADSDKVVDCSMPRSQYTSAAQRRHCPDYLEYAGVD